jgi:hypothetical protein
MATRKKALTKQDVEVMVSQLEMMRGQIDLMLEKLKGTPDGNSYPSFGRGWYNGGRHL